jgi:AcrR family transcriptional regulator
MASSRSARDRRSEPSGDAPPRTRDRRPPEARREQILEEAARLISQKGYYGFIVRECAEQCGLSEPGLLHHFGSKERLLIAVLENRDRIDSEFISAKMGTNADDPRPLSRPEVLQLLRTIVAYNSTKPEFARLYVILKAEALNDTHPAHDYFMSRQDAVLENFARMLEPHVSDPAGSAIELLSLMQGLEQEWLRQGQAFDLVAAWDHAATRLIDAAR